MGQTTLLDSAGTDVVPVGPSLPTTNQTPMSLIEAAVAGGADIEKLERLFELQERWEKNRAAEAFSSAKAEFQSRCPVIQRKREAGEGGFKYKFAAYEDIMEIARPILNDVGISTGFDSELTDKGIRTICRLRKGIHFEDTAITLPVPSNMRVNDTQKMGAAFSYGKRNAICAALDIVIGDEDTDAAGLGECIGTGQAFDLDEMMQRKVFDRAKFLKYFEIENIDHLPAAKFEEAMMMLSRKPEKK